VYWRTLRRARMVSQVSMSQLYACTPAKAGAVLSRLVRAQNRGWPTNPHWRSPRTVFLRSGAVASGVTWHVAAKVA